MQLLKFVRQRFQQEQAEKKEYEAMQKQEQEAYQAAEKATENKKIIPEQSLLSRERKNLLKAIGILVHLLTDQKERSLRSHDKKPRLSALQISQMMIEKAEHLGVEIEGLKSFDRKITETLELLQEEII